MTNNSSSSHETSEFNRREEFLASRKVAGQLIDVETCKIWESYCEMLDPYGCGPPLGECSCVERQIFVRSAESDGRVWIGDLPDDKYRALIDRIDRAKRTPTTAEGVRDVLLEEYARAVAALDEVIDDVVLDRFQNLPLDIVRCGVRLALAALGKQGTSQQERIERRLRS